jgi:hypothetical protein
MNSLLASVAGSGLYTNTAGTWTALPSSVAGTGEQRALVQTDADTYWIGGADGVFRRDDGAGDFAEIGDLTDVRALSVYVSPANQATMYATAGAGLTLYRWVDGSEPAWTPISTNLPAGAGIAGHPLVLDGTVALLGTSAGVYRTLDGGQTWVPTNPGGVSGPPLARADGIYWLLAGGQGLIRSTDNGLTWSSVVGAGQIHPNANRLAQLPDGSLLTVGMETGGTKTLLKITLSTAGATTAPYGPLLPYVPSGVTHSGTATYIWSSTCASGSDVANAIMSFADP